VTTVLGLIATVIGVYYISVITKKEVESCLKEIEEKLRTKKTRRLT